MLDDYKSFNPNDPIYADGDPATHLYLVHQGSVTTQIAGETITLGQGQIFGDGGMVSGKYKTTMRAGPSGCMVLPVEIDRLKAEIGRSPPMVRLFITNMLAHFEIATDLLKK